MNPAGEAMVVWQQDNGTVSSVCANRYAGGTWGSPIIIASQTENNSVFMDPQVAMDASGNAIVVWDEIINSTPYVDASRFLAGQWSAATVIGGGPDEDAYLQPQIAMDNGGDAVVAWTQLEAPATANASFHYGVHVNAFLAGTWGMASRIDALSTADDELPRVAVDGNGNAFLVWQRSSEGNSSVCASRLSTGTWSGTKTLSSTPPGYSGVPMIAASGDGDAMAVWNDGDNISANRFTGGTWGTAVAILANSSGIYEPPQIAMDESGNAVVVWVGGGGVYATSYTAPGVAGSDTTAFAIVAVVLVAAALAVGLILAKRKR
ncbi:MAG: hypothetical protein ABR879_05115 [Methanomassiliicoccales archaeon]|jgi:hypothetical protein